MCPGLIDAHARIESSLTTPNEYYKGALIHGITSVITDPHEIANVLGLAEVMSYPAVLNCEENMINKIWDAKEKGLVIDGHGAGFDETMINAYTTANITTDHECHNKEEVIDRLRRGMYVLIREGTVAKNLKELIKATSIANSRRVCFCTDDKHIDDLIKIAVIERHKGTGNIGLGIINGLGIKEGAIATTIAHDSHNIIVSGCSDEDMIFAVNEL